MVIKHKLVQDWLLYVEVYKYQTELGDVILVDKDIYDSFKDVVKGIACRYEDGTKYAITKELFDKHKKEKDDLYYLDRKSWRMKKE